tara:strand:+ start:1199 stop:1384 length:186 start_codon:yes stop_codon:yes gene_type:complete
MEKEVKLVQNSQESTSESSNKSKKVEKIEEWDGILEIDPLTVRHIIEANQLVEDLEEAGEL